MNPDKVQAVPEATEEEATEIQAMEVGSPVPSWSLSSDFEVPPSSRKVISSEETVTVNKVDSTDVKADTRPVRITRTKAKVVSSAGGKQTCLQRER